MNNKFECFNEVVSDVNENDLNLYASATDVYYNNGQYQYSYDQQNAQLYEANNWFNALDTNRSTTVTWAELYNWILYQQSY